MTKTFEKHISKSQFMMGLQCVKRLWLYNYRKDLIPPTEPAVQRMLDEGHAVGLLAHEYFKGGQLVAFDYMQIPQAIKQTAELIKTGANIIYEGTFVFNNLLVRCDILKKNSDNSWDLIEVKSSTHVKQEHLPDAAIQRYVLEGSGLKIKKVQLMHINNQFVKNGPIQPELFFTLQDITKESVCLQEAIVADLQKFMKILAETKEPEIEIGYKCNEPYKCEFCNYCWKDVPEDSIYYFSGLKRDKIERLIALGITRIRDIPENFHLSDVQKLHLDAEKTQKEHIDSALIGDFLKQISYPIYFIDFETINPAIPLYDGTRPFQNIPFEVSIDVQKNESGKIQHFEYLGDGRSDPRGGVISCVLDSISQQGTVIAYNTVFEAKVLEDLAEAYPANSREILSIKERLVDIAEPFKKSYIHPAFRGGWSMKTVLPVLVPSMTYENMPISEGGEAQTAYFNLMSGKLSEKETEETICALKEYCRQDTLGMFELLKILKSKAIIM